MNNIMKNKLSNFAVLNIISLICFLCLSPTVRANPQGGKVVGGNATITTPSAAQTVIQQNSDKAIINWDQFNIDFGEHTKFIQPSAGSVTLNRVVGNDPSKILGRLSANGKLVLVNPNGVFFGPDAKVDVAAMIATTNDITNDDFMAGRLNFTIPGKPGAQIINQGTMTIQEGGLVALVAPSVQNNGLIQARLGKVVLASANTFTLDLYGDDLILFEADCTITEQIQDAFGNTLDSSIGQNGIIEADGGYVLLTTDVAKNVVDNAINMTGIIKAQSVEEQSGTIILNAGEGKTYVSGQLDASAPDGGDGGFIETSGAEVVIDEGSRIDTSSVFGSTGQWLLDPTDYYISASDGDITGETLGAYLGLNNVIIQTATTGSENGDIYVNDDISWATSNKLTLKAYRNIFVNNDITGVGGGDLDFISGDSGNGVGAVVFSPESRISLTGSGDNAVQIFYNTADYTSPTSFSSYVSSGDLTAYMLVNDVDELQAMNTNLSGNYALSQNIDASDTETWNGGEGFVPIGETSSFVPIGPYLGKFNGNGFSIENLYIDAFKFGISVGLFGSSSGVISNTKIENARVTGENAFVGALVGRNTGGIIYNCSSSGIVRGKDVGGLVGTNSGNIINSSSSANISPEYGNVWGGIGGGLVGVNQGEIFSSFASGSCIPWGMDDTLGGLVGKHISGLISSCYATGNINGGVEVGSLIGENPGGGHVINSYSIGAVSGSSQGGMLGGGSSCSDCSGNYWNIDTSGFSTSLIGIGLSDSEMKQQSSFTGWDFNNVWSIDEGISYPTLKWQESDDGSILFVSDSLSVNSDTGTISYTENEVGALTFPTSSFSGTHCPSVEVYFENGFVAGQDYLDFVQSGNVTGSYDSSTGVLTLSGLATVEEYESVLNSVTYRNYSDNPDSDTREIGIKVGRASAYRVLNITPVNDAPIVDTSSDIDFQENATDVILFPDVNLNDVDSTELTGATIQLSSGFSPTEDRLAFVDQNNISGIYDSATGVLQLSGTASLAEYQTAIRSIQYVNTSDAPSTTQRSASITVTDGEDASGQLLSTVTITPVNDAPVLDTSVYGGNTPTGGVRTTTINVANNTGVLVTDLMAAGGSGFVTDVDSNNIGIAVTSLDAPDGTWQYTLNNGTTWQNFPSVSDSNALLLTADQQTRVRYVPDKMSAGTSIERAIAFFAWDQSYGNNGEAGVNVNVRGDDTAYSIDWARGYLSLSKADNSSSGGTDNIGTDNIGTDNAGTDNAGTDNAGTDNAVAGSTDNAGTDNAGTDNAGTDNIGTDNAGTDNAGTDNTGTDNAGNDNAGTDNTGTDNAGTDNAVAGSTDNAGTDNAGTDNIGTDNAGNDNAGTDNTGTDNTGTDNAVAGSTDNAGTGSTDLAQLIKDFLGNGEGNASPIGSAGDSVEVNERTALENIRSSLPETWDWLSETQLEYMAVGSESFGEATGRGETELVDASFSLMSSLETVDQKVDGYLAEVPSYMLTGDISIEDYLKNSAKIRLLIDAYDNTSDVYVDFAKYYLTLDDENQEILGNEVGEYFYYAADDIASIKNGEFGNKTYWEIAKDSFVDSGLELYDVIKTSPILAKYEAKIFFRGASQVVSRFDKYFDAGNDAFKSIEMMEAEIKCLKNGISLFANASVGILEIAEILKNDGFHLSPESVGKLSDIISSVLEPFSEFIENKELSRVSKVLGLAGSFIDLNTSLDSMKNIKSANNFVSSFPSALLSDASLNTIQSELKLDYVDKTLDAILAGAKIIKTLIPIDILDEAVTYGEDLKSVAQPFINSTRRVDERTLESFNLKYIGNENPLINAINFRAGGFRVGSEVIGRRGF